MPLGTRWGFRSVSALGKISKWKRFAGERVREKKSQRERERKRDSSGLHVAIRGDAKVVSCSGRVNFGRRGDGRSGRFVLNREHALMTTTGLCGRLAAMIPYRN